MQYPPKLRDRPEPYRLSWPWRGFSWSPVEGQYRR